MKEHGGPEDPPKERGIYAGSLPSQRPARPAFLGFHGYFDASRPPAPVVGPGMVVGLAGGIDQDGVGGPDIYHSMPNARRDGDELRPLPAGAKNVGAAVGGRIHTTVIERDADRAVAAEQPVDGGSVCVPGRHLARRKQALEDV